MTRVTPSWMIVADQVEGAEPDELDDEANHRSNRRDGGEKTAAS
jgi:hypothetical protein